MGIREGLLVLLGRGPQHGYQLKLDFESATGSAWSLNVGQVYSTLQRLERDELVTVESEDEDGRIAYRLTLAGRDEAHAWLATPVAGRISTRDELSMKLLLAIASGAGDPQAIIDAQRQSTMVDLQDYTALRDEADAADLAWPLHLDRLALASEAQLRWLDRVERRLAAHARPGDSPDDSCLHAQDPTSAARAETRGTSPTPAPTPGTTQKDSR